VAEGGSPGSQPGWREVVLVAATVVAVVLAAAVGTSLLPASVQEIVFRTPIAIGVLIVGTGWLLWRISRREPGSPGR
jgi:uncharacterized membrane-anchored protein